MNRPFKRILSLILVLVMCISLAPVSAFADDGEEPLTEELPPEEVTAAGEPEAAETEHVHEYVLMEEIPATEEAEGIKEHYVCASCDMLFVLENGEYIEVTAEELIIPMLTSEEEPPREEEPEEEEQEEPEEPDESGLELSLAGEIIDQGTCGAEGDNLTWILTDDGTLTISGTGEMEDYEIIPDGTKSSTAPWADYSVSVVEVIIGEEVSGIGGYAFYNCSRLTSVTIPATVTSIGRYVFERCSLLKTAGPTGSGCDIEFGWTTAIPDYAFWECSSLTAVEIPTGVTSIEGGAFSRCSSLTEITIPNSLVIIGAGAFAHTGLTSVVIPDSVGIIGPQAFSGCTGLADVRLSNRIVNIWDETFKDCSALTSILIPYDVAAIKTGAFSGCGVTNVYYPGSEENWNAITIESGNECLATAAIITDRPVNSGTCGNNLLWTLDENGVLAITGTGDMWSHDPEEYSWNSVRDKIKNVVISDGVTEIGPWAFAGCDLLEKVTIPASVTDVAYEAFSRCPLLTSAGPTGSGASIEFGWTAAVPPNAFSNSNLSTVTIPVGITLIGDAAFQNCSSLTTVTLSESITNIGDNAFYGCSALSDVYFNGTGEVWGNIAIATGNEPLVGANIHFGDVGIIASGECGAEGGNLLWTLYTNGLLEITGSGAMADWDNSSSCPWDAYLEQIKDISLADGVTSIGDYAFYECSSLSTVDNLPDSLRRIGRMAFGDGGGGDGNALTSIVIPEGVESIGVAAFINCRHLTTVNIPAGVTDIEGNPFIACTGLTAITVSPSATPGTEKYFSVGNCLIDRENKTIVSGITASIIPDDGTVTKIGGGAFAAFDTISSIVIPECITEIGESAFALCKGLKSVILPTQITTIKEGTFDSCDGLVSVRIPANVTSLGENAFGGCNNLKTVYITGNVSDIGNGAFVFCTSLTDVFYNGTADEWDLITIGTDNEPLTGANIHFNSQWGGVVLETGDVFSFNSDSLQYINTQNGYNMTQADYDWLTAPESGLSAVELGRITEAVGKKYEGAFFGVSAVTVLAKAGLLNIGDFAQGAGNLSDVSMTPTDGESVDPVLSLLNYYEMLLNTNAIDGAAYNCISDESSNLAQIYGALSEGFPVILNVARVQKGRTRVIFPVAFGLEDTGTGFRFMVYDSKIGPTFYTITVERDGNQYRVADFDGWNENSLYRKDNLVFRKAITVSDLCSVRLLTVPGGTGKTEIWDGECLIETDASDFTVKVAEGSTATGYVKIEGRKIVDRSVNRIYSDFSSGPQTSLKMIPLEENQRFRIERIVGASEFKVDFNAKSEDGKSFSINLSAADSGTLEVDSTGKCSYSGAAVLSYSSDSMSTSWNSVCVESDDCGLTITPVDDGTVRIDTKRETTLKIILSNGDNSVVLEEVPCGSSGVVISESENGSIEINGLAREEIFGFTVTFKETPESIFETVFNVGYGTLIEKPTDPTSVLGTFNGCWYKDENCTEGTEWDFESDTVLENTVLYAGWEANNVRFMVDGECIKSICCDDGGLISPDDAPVKADETAYEWYKDPGFTETWDFASDAVRENADLYAYSRACAVSFISVESSERERTVYKMTDVPIGTLIEMPEECEGVTGWYKDRELSEAWDFGEDRISEDTAIYCAWTAPVTVTQEVSVEFAGNPSGSFSYTGSAICPEITVKYNGTVLRQGTDYSVKYKNNKKICDADNEKLKNSKKPQITITFKGNYKTKGKLTVYFSIVPFDLSSAEVILPDIVQVKKNDRKQTPAIAVNNGNRSIPKSDYTVSYYTDRDRTNRVNGITSAGEYYVSVSARTSSVSGRCDIETPIQAKAVKDISGQKKQFSLSWNKGESVYNGTDQKPEVAAGSLTEGADYTVIYPENSSAAGKYRITVRGCGDYCGSFTLEYRIKPLELKAAYAKGQIVLDCDRTAEYSPAGARPTVRITMNCPDGVPMTLEEGKDYSLKIKDGKQTKKEGSVTVTGKGNFKGSLDKKTAGDLVFKIQKKNLNADEISVCITYIKKTTWQVRAKVYDGAKEITKQCTIGTATNSRDGNVFVLISAKVSGNYTGSVSLLIPKNETMKVTTRFSKNKAAEVEVKIDPSELPCTFTGKEQTPALMIRNAAGEIMSPEEISENFIISYSNNINVGKKATVKITGRAEKGYYGSVTLTFKIKSPLYF